LASPPHDWTAVTLAAYLADVTPRQWLLSALFAALIVLKVAEAALRLESWPLTDVRMFSARVPPRVTPYDVTLHATRGGPWFELTAFDFGIGPEELRRRLPADIAVLPAVCGDLGRLYNASHPGAGTLTGLRARVTRLQRPGVPSEPFDETVECPLTPPRAAR